jgi:hypothetical protein
MPLVWLFIFLAFNAGVTITAYIVITIHWRAGVRMCCNFSNHQITKERFMRLKINKEETEFLRFLTEERRAQIRAIIPLWNRHHRQDAKRIMDGFPYEKGDLIPYIKTNKDGSVLLWDATTHQDLIADIRDHLNERQRSEDESNGSIRVVHELLKKIEAMAEDANLEIKSL